MKRVGFIGLGTMGLPMAANLVRAGHHVRGYDLGEAQRRKAEESGIEVVPTAMAVADGVDLLITMLPKGEHVRSVLIGAEGLFDSLAKGTVVVDCSTIDIDTARDLAKIGADAGIDVLDAPVSGGVGGATDGTLTFMVGGEAATLERARFAFDAMGARTFHCGGAGAGQVAKTCNQLVFGSNLAAASEAFVLGERLGLSSETIFEVITTSSGDSRALRTFCPRPGIVEGVAADDGYAARFAADLLEKDLGLAMAAGNTADLGLTVAAAAYELMNELVQDSPKLDCSAVIKLVETKTPGPAQTTLHALTGAEAERANA